MAKLSFGVRLTLLCWCTLALFVLPEVSGQSLTYVGDTVINALGGYGTFTVPADVVVYSIQFVRVSGYVACCPASSCASYWGCPSYQSTGIGIIVTDSSSNVITPVISTQGYSTVASNYWYTFTGANPNATSLTLLPPTPISVISSPAVWRVWYGESLAATSLGDNAGNETVSVYINASTISSTLTYLGQTSFNSLSVFGNITIPANTLVNSIILSYVSGGVACCAASNCYPTNWGCSYFGTTGANMIITDANNNIIAPVTGTQGYTSINSGTGAWYTFPGAVVNATTLNLLLPRPYVTVSSVVWKLWYGEVLTSSTLSDNSGSVVARVYLNGSNIAPYMTFLGNTTVNTLSTYGSFTVPAGTYVSSIVLSSNSGGLTCCSTCPMTNWGCTVTGAMGMLITHANNTLIAPTYGTRGYTLVSAPDSAGGWYTYPGFNYYYSTLNLIFSQAINVTSSVTWRVWYGEALYAYTLNDNSGSENISVYALSTNTPPATLPPTPAPTADPTPSPTPSPTSAPTPSPTSAPTPAPTRAPTPAPTRSPTRAPTPYPTSAPTRSPTPAPTQGPIPLARRPVQYVVGSSVQPELSWNAPLLSDPVTGATMTPIGPITSPTSGLTSGSKFPYGVTQVKYNYQSALNGTIPYAFDVNVVSSSSEIFAMHLDLDCGSDFQTQV